MNNNDIKILQIIQIHVNAIAFVNEEIQALEEKKPWKLKNIIEKNNHMIKEFAEAKITITQNTSMLQECSPDYKKTLIKMCKILQSALEQKAILLESAMFVNESIMKYIKQAVQKSTYNGYYKQKNQTLSVAFNKEI